MSKKLVLTRATVILLHPTLSVSCSTTGGISGLELSFMEQPTARNQTITSEMNVFIIAVFFTVMIFLL
jgi:hypothetical protein